jgi:SAM-dependent methyltransferase
MIPEQQKEIVRRGYDKLSYAYRADDTRDDYEDYASWIGVLAERLPGGVPVLDIGCGCGLPATRVLADRFEVTGVDFSEVQIERARRLVPAARFVCGDISEQSFAPGSYAAIVSFYAIIHMPLEEHAGLFRKIALWLRPAGYFLATVGHSEWTGEDETYLGIPGGRMCWSHADEAANLRWIEDAGLHVLSTEFVPEGKSGHTLVFAQKPPIEEAPTTSSSRRGGTARLKSGVRHTEKMKIDVTDSVQEEDVADLRAGLDEFNLSVAPRDCRDLGVFIRKQGRLIAGAYGESVWDWIHIKYLWVDAKHRRSGLGREIMEAVEDECRRRGCVGVHLDTYSFQALPFYEKCGYVVFGSVADHPRGGTRYYLKKEIKANTASHGTGCARP